jgi:periplasmic divalent cation tolerance protein
MISVHTTVPDEETAEEMAHKLVEERTASCVNAYPVSSTYRWEGEVVEEKEIVLDVKTSLPYDEIRELIESIHPYDIPAVLRVETEANEEYDEWVRRTTD